MGFKTSSVRVVAVLALSVAAAAPVLGQAASTGKSDPLAVKKLGTGWEEIDSRMVFLTMQLSSVESSLAAVNKAILMTGYQQRTRANAAEQYRSGNELMDRKGGGPVPWNEFYGSTAEKFFYHPQTDNASLSVRVLRGGQATLTASREQATNAPIETPPQFESIYRANEQAKAKAEADIAALGNKVDALLARRRQLESEQSALWAQIVTRSVVCRSLNEKPWYRLELTSAENSPDASEKLKAAKAAAKLIRTHLAVLEKAEDSKRLDEAAVYGDLEKIAAAARLEFADVIYMQRTLQQDMGDVQKPVGRFFALSKRASDQTKNINDAYQVAAESDKVGDDLRKGTSRGLLQSSLVNYAETILALDEVFGVMIREWNIEAVPGKPAEKIELKLSDYSKAAAVPAMDEKVSAVTAQKSVENNKTSVEPARTSANKGITNTATEARSDALTAAINAADLWTKVNFKVTKGKIYEISASGRWSGSVGGTVGPAGLCPPDVIGTLGPAEPNKKKLLKNVFYEKHPKSALIARFNSADWTFYVGSKVRFIAPMNDTLSFRINDTDLDSVARNGSVTLTISETSAQEISAANGLSITAWEDAFDFLHVTTGGIYWEYGGSWSRVGEHEGNYPTLVNGILWWPTWKNKKTTELLPIADIGEISSNAIRIKRDFSLRGGVKIERQDENEAVFKFADDGLGASIVAAEFVIRK